MRILILCDLRLAKFTPALQAPYSLLRSKNSWASLLKDGEDLTLSICVGTEQGIWEEAWDIIVVYNALDLYLGNRFYTKGRSWVAVASFCFEDTNVFYANSVPVADMGIDAIFTNCRPFVERGAPHLPTKFMYPPIGNLKSGSSINPDFALGAVIPDVVDRDFSQLEWSYRYLKLRGLAHRLGVYAYNPEEVRRQFPDSEFIHGLVSMRGYRPHSHLPYYIPTMRVSDIAFGCIDAEMMTALTYSQPLVITHNKFPALREWITPVFTSLDHYGDTLVKIANKADVEYTRDLPYGEEETDEKFIAAVKLAYQRKLENATS